jgi:hypothetical protein
MIFVLVIALLLKVVFWLVAAHPILFYGWLGGQLLLPSDEQMAETQKPPPTEANG